MSRWPRGEAQIEQLIASRQMQQVIGGQANGAHLLEKASRTLETAGEIADQDPDSAYVLAYDAARYSGTAILAHQGLRPTTSGGHYAVEVALRAQFGDGLRPSAQCDDDETSSNTQPSQSEMRSMVAEASASPKLRSFRFLRVLLSVDEGQIRAVGATIGLLSGSNSRGCMALAIVILSV